VKILFLSAEKPHTDMFLQIVDELERIIDKKVEFTILDTNKLNIRPQSIRIPYKKEVQYIEQIIEKFKPNILVVANDLGIRTSFIRICNVHGIPSIAVQDGILANKKLTGFSRLLAWHNYFLWRVISAITNTQKISMLFIRLGRQWCVPDWGLGDATVIAAMGNCYKKVFLSRGVHSNKIVVTGYPLLDDFSMRCSDLNMSENLLKEIGLSNKRPLILLITQPLVEDGLWDPAFRVLHFEAIVKAVKDVKGQLIVKVHPRESVDIYRSLANKYRDINIIILKDFNMDQLLVSSDVIITVYSTVGLWAMAYKKPLLVMNCFPLPVENVLAQMALSVDELDKLPVVLNQILSDETQKTKLIAKELRSLYDHLYLLDGKASARIAKLILAIANDDRRNSEYAKKC
jgi:hypothetical protein